MARSNPSERKRRTRQHVIADLGVNHVERYVLLAGFTTERRLHDYGIDLVVSTYDPSGEIEQGEMLLQVKATDRLTTIRDEAFVTVRIDRRDLRAWLAESLPVILVVFDGKSERAWWLYVQAEYGGTKRFQVSSGTGTTTLRIPITNGLDTDAFGRFRGFRNRVLAQIRGVIHDNE